MQELAPLTNKISTMPVSETNPKTIDKNRVFPVLLLNLRFVILLYQPQ